MREIKPRRVRFEDRDENIVGYATMPDGEMLPRFVMDDTGTLYEGTLDDFCTFACYRETLPVEHVRIE